MASTSSDSWRYDVFPSFRGEDVRSSFLSHLLRELDRKLIKTFKDNGMERSRPIGTELLSAIKHSKIFIIVFSQNYATSTWCLDELAEIHKCYKKDSGQMVIPVFYHVDPSDVRKRRGDFGKTFEETCKDKTEDVKQRWSRVLTDVANLAGEDSRNSCDEAKLIEKIVNNVSDILITPSRDFGDFVGIEAHIEAISSMLCLESGEVRKVGIVGPSGIGKTTVARALFSRLSSQFDHKAFVVYKRTNGEDDYGMKLGWTEQLLSDILNQKDINISHLGVVEKRLENKKVLIVLDDIDDPELLKTFVGQTRLFGSGSIIILTTQDRQLLKSHEIGLVYEVKFPSKDLALQMFCRSAFGQNSPPHGFKELAVEVAELSGNLPLGLTLLGSSLRGRVKEVWVEMLPRLRLGLNGNIEKTLRNSYDRLEKEDQEIFLYIACILNGHTLGYIKGLLGDIVNNGIRILAEKSFIRITPSCKTVQMHSLLQKLGREIVRAELNPGKRRFLVDAKEISDVLSDNTGTENVLAICCYTSEINESLVIDKKSFKRMCNLEYLKFCKEWSQKTGEDKLYLPQGLAYLPRKLKLLYWDEYPLKSVPSSFRAECLVELRMQYSKLEKLWEGTQPLRSLKKMMLCRSTNLEEIPDLSKATDLTELYLRECTSLVTLPSSIRNLHKLWVLRLDECTKLEALPTDVNLESLGFLNLRGCSRLRRFPRISRNISRLRLDEGNALEEEEDCFWIKNLTLLLAVSWSNFPMRCMPSNFQPDHLIELHMPCSKLEKLWEGVKSLGCLKELNLSGSKNLEKLPELLEATRLKKMDLSGCESLKEMPDLSNVTNLEYLELSHCKSLVTLPFSIGNLNKLRELNMNGCTRLDVLPTDVNLKSLYCLNLNGCSRLRSFPRISRNISKLYMNDTAIKEVPSWVENISGLRILTMRRCMKLKNISPSMFKFKSHVELDFSDCEGVTTCSDSPAVTMVVPQEKAFFPDCEYFQNITPSFYGVKPNLRFNNCFNLDGDARNLILQSDFKVAVLPGGEVPQYFTHRACGNSIVITLPQSSLAQYVLQFKACVVLLQPLGADKIYNSSFRLLWYFRGTNGCQDVSVDSCQMDHMVRFNFDIPTNGFSGPSSEPESNDIKFYFTTSFKSCFLCLDNDYPCDYCSSDQRVKECGIRILSVTPTRSGIERRYLWPWCNQLSGENEEESERSKKRMRIDG